LRWLKCCKIKLQLHLSCALLIEPLLLLAHRNVACHFHLPTRPTERFLDDWSSQACGRFQSFHSNIILA
jgi:hypothetical protein